PVVNTGTTSTIINTVLGALAGTLVNSAGTGTVIKNNATAIVNNLNPGIFGTQWSDLGNTGSTKPKAYLNVMFFDERMHYVGEGSISQRVQIAGDGAAPLALLNIKVPKNGYCMVFVSNESGEYVYFDDMIVRHDRGRILEENHYYSFGLKIATLSSRAFGAPNNAYGYQREFNELDEDLGWHDFTLRSYDPQIGRFLQVDPYDQFASGYVGMGNDPVNTIDQSGGWVSSAASAIAQVGCPGVSGLTSIASVGYSAMSTISSLASSFFTVMNITVRSINDGNINTGRPNSLNTFGMTRPRDPKIPIYMESGAFEAADEAAAHFALTWGKYAGDCLEYGAVIYKIKVGNEIKYTYEVFKGNDCLSPTVRLGHELLKRKVKYFDVAGYIHTHPVSDNFSTKDNDPTKKNDDWTTMERHGDKDFYLVTPDGDLIVNRGFRESNQTSNGDRDELEIKYTTADKKVVDNRSVLMTNIKTMRNGKTHKGAARIKSGKWRNANDKLIPGIPAYMEKYFQKPDPKKIII
ncbi:RHS repeat-associated core domain-containing protein, partial [Polluticaenibacter yanchengensis]|nr:hypothetical protein [Chitinophagaceae bacterium LY-5]